MLTLYVASTRSTLQAEASFKQVNTIMGHGSRLGWGAGSSWLGGSAIAALVVVVAPTAQAAVLSSWQFDPASHQFTITLPQGVTPHFLVAAEPARIILEIPQTQLDGALESQVFTGAVRQIRLAQYDPQTIRVVLELAPGTVLDPDHAQLSSAPVNGQTRWTLTPLVVDGAVIAGVPGSTSPSQAVTAASPAQMPPPTTRARVEAPTILAAPPELPPMITTPPPGSITPVAPEQTGAVAGATSTPTSPDQTASVDGAEAGDQDAVEIAVMPPPAAVNPEPAPPVPDQPTATGVNPSGITPNSPTPPEVSPALPSTLPTTTSSAPAGETTTTPAAPAEEDYSLFEGPGRLSTSASNLMLPAYDPNLAELPDTLAIDPFALNTSQPSQAAQAPVSVPSLTDTFGAGAIAAAPTLPNPDAPPMTNSPAETAPSLDLAASPPSSPAPTVETTPAPPIAAMPPATPIPTTSPASEQPLADQDLAPGEISAPADQPDPSIASSSLPPFANDMAPATTNQSVPTQSIPAQSIPAPTTANLAEVDQADGDQPMASPAIPELPQTVPVPSTEPAPVTSSLDSAPTSPPSQAPITTSPPLATGPVIPGQPVPSQPGTPIAVVAFGDDPNPASQSDQAIPGPASSDQGMIETAPPEAPAAPPTPITQDPPFLPTDASQAPGQTDSNQTPDWLAVPTAPPTTAPATTLPPLPQQPATPIAIASTGGAIDFGQPLPAAAGKGLEADPWSPNGSPQHPLAPDILIPAGTVLQLRYTGHEPLDLTSGTETQQVLRLETEIRDPVTQGVVAPVGSQVVGQFEAFHNGQQWISQMLVVPAGQQVPFDSRSDYLAGSPMVSGGGLALGTGLGALALTVLTGFTGIGLVGGAMLGATAVLGTSPQLVTIEPNQVIEVQVVDDVSRAVPLINRPGF